MTTTSDAFAHADKIPAFLEAIRRRLEDGHREYGGVGFGYSDSKLTSEMQQELEDVPGYLFLRWATWEARRERLEWLERVAAAATQVASQLDPHEVVGGRMLGVAALEGLRAEVLAEPGREARRPQNGTSP